MTYTQAIRFLYDLSLFGTKLGLDNTFKLAALAGNPQDCLRFIHVAGTNGKGSTCAMLESVYRAAGLRVGLFTSPHLVAFNERIQVNRQPISDPDVSRLVERLQSLLKHFPDHAPPTFFEVVTVMALIYFAEQRCQLVVWETGMGGRLDATNIVHPLASVITNIHADHQKWLGTTLAQISQEKAGVIKPDTPVVTAVDEPQALSVLAETARQHQAPLSLVTQNDLRQSPLRDLELPLLGEHQRWNAAVALATIRALSAQIPIQDRIIRSGLSQVDWPGRMQLVRTDSGQQLLLDGAHNGDSAHKLRLAFQKSFPGINPTLVLGILEDKDWTTICGSLAPLARRILLVPVHSARTASPSELASLCQSANPSAEIKLSPALAEALAIAKRDPFLLITGSLYLVGETMDLLHLAPGAGKNERLLNEWSALK